MPRDDYIARRGQAYTALGALREAVRDLQKALALSPDSEKDTIREKLREAQEKERLASRGALALPRPALPCPAYRGYRCQSWRRRARLRGIWALLVCPCAPPGPLARCAVLGASSLLLQLLLGPHAASGSEVQGPARSAGVWLAALQVW